MPDDVDASGARRDAAETTDDAFLGGALALLQPRSGYRAGIDAVLLAATVDASSGAELLDLGAGVGTVGLSAARRLDALRVTLVESDPEAAALARRNIARNGLDDRVRLVVGDVTGSGARLGELGLPFEAFDAAVANPPYHAEGRGTTAALPGKAAANAMPASALDLWVRAMARHVRPEGRATLIHTAAALPALLDAMAGRFGGLRVLPIHPRAGEPASRVIVRGIKSSRAPLALLSGLVLHGDGHAFTPEADRILRHGAPLAV